MKNICLVLLAAFGLIACGPDPYLPVFPPQNEDRSVITEQYFESETVDLELARLEGVIGTIRVNHEARVYFDHRNSHSSLINISVAEVGNAAMLILNVDGNIDSLRAGYYYYEPHGDYNEELHVFGRGCAGYRTGLWDYDDEAASVEMWINENESGERIVDFEARFNPTSANNDETTVATGYLLLQ